MTQVKRVLSGGWRFKSLLILNSVLFFLCHDASQLVSGVDVIETTG